MVEPLLPMRHVDEEERKDTTRKGIRSSLSPSTRQVHPYLQGHPITDTEKPQAMNWKHRLPLLPVSRLLSLPFHPQLR